MPQMAPLNWTMMYVPIIFLFLFIIIVNYFIFLYKDYLSRKKNNNEKSHWKW
uniref:ATP synthase complex subunit 8 n=1 Tax=Curculionidae sp. 5 AH-2016 TaxID=1903831 RepID=A0A343C4K8_9CUCU|nr:ATP synthase F0 subunit 8 [Curculionidae sp. 5 AH-2016]